MISTRTAYNPYNLPPLSKLTETVYFDFSDATRYDRDPERLVILAGEDGKHFSMQHSNCLVTTKTVYLTSDRDTDTYVIEFHDGNPSVTYDSEKEMIRAAGFMLTRHDFRHLI